MPTIQGNNASKRMEKNTKPNKYPGSKGQLTRFGFKKPPPVPQPSLPSIPASTDDFTVVQETIQPLVINSIHSKNGTPLPSRGKKELKPVNRFGFVPPGSQLSNKVADVNGASAQENGRPMAKTTACRLSPAGRRSVSETRYNKFQGATAGSVQNLTKSGAGVGPLPTAVYYKSNESLVGSPSADKLAKTAANNHMVYRSQKGNAFGFPNSTVKLQRNDSKMEIQQLEQSPGAATKFRHQERARPMEMVFPSDRNGGGVTKFELRDVKPEIQEQQLTQRHQEQPVEVSNSSNPHARLAERIRREVVNGVGSSTGVEMTRSVEDELSSEEKQRRDKKDSEKFQKDLEDESPEEDLWGGPGEAMALEDEFPCATLAAIDQSPEAMNVPLRSVLLTIEDPTFAVLAAISKPGMIDDEQPPDESPDISCSSPSSIDPLPPPPANITGSKSASPQSPGTPSHASNSLSSDAKDRDFLIDDEIADQPGLVFDGDRHLRGLDEHEVRRSKQIAALAGEVSQVLANLSCSTKDNILRASNSSLASTLSPCESLASDDLMVDFDQSEISMVDDLDRDDAPYKSEVLKQSDQVIKEWSTLLNSYPRLASSKRKSRPLTTNPLVRTKIDSEPKPVVDTSSSQPPSYPSSPVRHAVKTKNASSDNSEDSGVGKGMYHSMYQDIVSIKSGLLLLQKFLQESSDSGQPLQSSGEEGLELEDLRRQIFLLELENQEKDRRIAKLEEELKTARETKLPPGRTLSTTAVNKATQTDKVRPLSTTLFHNSPNNSTASIVSFQLGKTFNFE